MKLKHLPPHTRLNGRLRAEEEKRQVSRQEYDFDTGQVYDEVEIVFKKKQSSDWIGELKTPTIVRKFKPVESGSRSLSDMAKQKCVTEFRSLTSEHFEAVPWSLATNIWGQIVSTHRESFHAWRTLASVYNRKDEFGNPNHRYHLEIRQPPLPTTEYFRGLSSSHLSWALALRISPRQISIPDTIAIASIPNLTVLDLSDGQLLLDPLSSRLDERILRTWAELASSGRAFNQLQVLLLGWQDNVSHSIFKYLDSFPRLRLVLTTDCRDLHQKNRTEWESAAMSYGWTAQHAKKSAKLLRPMLDDRDFHVAAISNLYYQTGHVDEARKPNTLPMVECWLGTPRRWTHILDEFPGTRTIWFEKLGDGASGTGKDLLTATHSTDSTKRERETGSPSQTFLSPPRKKPHSGRSVRPRAPLKTAASLLAEMNI